MTMREYTQARLAAAERDLEYATSTAGFRLWERTKDGERDVTAEHVELLRRVVDEYRRVLANLPG